VGKQIIEVPLDDKRTILVEVDEADDYNGGTLAPIADPGEILARASGSVRSAIDEVIKPAVDMIFDRLGRGAHAPESVELEFGLKLAGKLGAVFATTESEGHINVKMTWKHPPSASSSPSA